MGISYISENVAVKRSEGIKVFRKEGRILAVAPASGGSALIEEGDAAFFSSLNRPRMVGALLAESGGKSERRMELLENWYAAGIIQVLGKTGVPLVVADHNDSVCLSISRMRPGRVEEGGNAPVAASLSLRQVSLGEDAECIAWEQLVAKAGELPLAIDAVVRDEEELEWLKSATVNMASRENCRLVVHCPADASVAERVGEYLHTWSERRFATELLLYGEVDKWSAYQDLLQALQIKGVACLPVGVIAHPQQLLPWVQACVQARYRTVGVACESLLQGEIWERQEMLQQLVAQWLEVLDYRGECELPLRVHPLERWLVYVSRGMWLDAPQRWEALYTPAEDCWRWAPVAELAPMCGRCYARAYCADLARCQAGGAACWFRKTLFEALLWRLRTDDKLLASLFNKRCYGGVQSECCCSTEQE